MKHLITFCTTVALCAGASAQAKYNSSPDGYLAKEGEDRCYIMFEYSTARTMFLDGEMRGKVMLMNEVAFRYDNRNYTASVGMGRSWTSVTMDVATCDYSKASLTFAANQTSTPSRVWSGPLTLPTQSGYPAKTPADFSMAFPFSNPWLYNGTTDICLDFDFNGGTMANNANWPAKWYWSYYIDAPSAGTRIQGVFSQIGTGCTDSALSSPAYGWVTSYVHNSKHTTYPDTYRVYTASGNTPDKAPVIHAMSVFGNKTGINFPGTTCEKLYIDTSKFFVTFPLLGGGTQRVYGPDIVFPHNKAYEGIPVYGQVAFADSVTGQFKLSYAEDTILPAYPRIFKRGCLWQEDPALKATTAANSAGQIPMEDATHNPVIRYGY